MHIVFHHKTTTHAIWVRLKSTRAMAHFIHPQHAPPLPPNLLVLKPAESDTSDSRRDSGTSASSSFKSDSGAKSRRGVKVCAAWGRCMVVGQRRVHLSCRALLSPYWTFPHHVHLCVCVFCLEGNLPTPVFPQQQFPSFPFPQVLPTLGGRVVTSSAPWPFIDGSRPSVVLPAYVDPASNSRVKRRPVVLSLALEEIKVRGGSAGVGGRGV